MEEVGACKPFFFCLVWTGPNVLTESTENKLGKSSLLVQLSWGPGIVPATLAVAKLQRQQNTDSSLIQSEGNWGASV